VRAKEDLVRSRRNADRPGRTGLHRSVCGRALRWLGTDRRPGTGIKRHVDGDLAKKVPLAIKHLDPAVAPVGYIYVALGVDRPNGRDFEAPRFAPGLPPALDSA